MIPRTLSASSILVSEACMARWKAEYNDRAPRISGTAASVGTSVHFALEHFVKGVYLDEKMDWGDVKALTQLYQVGFVETFGHTNFEADEYMDGATLVAKWYDRHKMGLSNKVLSCEVKENFGVKTSIGELPFNYIFDRQDRHAGEEEVYEVVDYKTIRAWIKPEDLKKKIQPRAYALAMQIMYPDAKRIWVTFDMLRHDTTVGVSFTRDENAQTYRYIKRAAERIIEADPELVEYTLNPECKWCPIKASCPALEQAGQLGMVPGMDLDKLTERKLAISSAVLALKYAEGELDDAILKIAEERDEFEFDTKSAHVEITARAMRKPNGTAITQIVGTEMALKYGNWTMTNVDKMMKNEGLPNDKIEQIKKEITKSYSSPSAKVTPLSGFEDE